MILTALEASFMPLVTAGNLLLGRVHGLGALGALGRLGGLEGHPEPGLIYKVTHFIARTREWTEF